jgi:hypothetical protein
MKMLMMSSAQLAPGVLMTSFQSISTSPPKVPSNWRNCTKSASALPITFRHLLRVTRRYSSGFAPMTLIPATFEPLHRSTTRRLMFAAHQIARLLELAPLVPSR